ncbi:hypothetical protein CHS0354_012300 [Potamilus streckersoni]|uniref:Sugar phosphate transporter domain-containing protein n=1 Tax=Potamilus streckersoni TaxID=2493646 RepID=A0AAE0SG38_9BIVA|nr:hypothetical protein CHS0354_012300 [Potamilus streckersoni]
MKNSAVLDAVKLILVCLLWYFSSASGNIIGKMVLNEFPYPMTLTMVQLTSTWICLEPILVILGVPKRGNIPTKYYLTMIVPLSLGKFVSSVLSQVSILKVSVSYAHTVKATLPLFTVIITRLFFGEKQTLPVYLSLVPIISGVVIATLTEISFDMIGLMSALFATLEFSLQTIFSKKINSNKTLMTLGLLICDGLLNMLQNVFAFTVLAMLAPLSYAVANATKRLVIIGASLLLLKNPVTPMNVVGILIAVLGVLFYNKAKFDQNEQARRQRLLPYVKSEGALTDANCVHGLSHPKSDYDTQHIQNSLLASNYSHLLWNSTVNTEQVKLIPRVHEENRTYSRISKNEELHSKGVHFV